MSNLLTKLGTLLRFRRDDSCSNLGIPKRLHANNREKDPIFLKDEKIYRRFSVTGNVDDWKKNNPTLASVFPLDDDSVNRSRYSKLAEDVLYNTREQDDGNHYMSHGILYFTVEKLLSAKPNWSNGQEVDFVFHLEHKPVPCMYPHTEIWTFRNGEKTDAKTKGSKSDRMLIRTALINIVEVHKWPS